MIKKTNPALLLACSQQRRCGAISKNNTLCGELKLSWWHSIATHYLMCTLNEKYSHCNLNIFARNIFFFCCGVISLHFLVNWTKDREKEKENENDKQINRKKIVFVVI